MKTKLILIIISVILLGGNIFMGYEWNRTYKEKKDYFEVIVKQNEIIDSLVNTPPRLNMEVKMNLTDKSKFEINGKNNSGTINVPTHRTYVLEVEYDSVSINTIYK